MVKIIKFTLTAVIICLGISIASFSFAQDNTNANTTAATTDEQISAQDLGVSNPTLLPDNPLYFLKEWTRKIRVVFTFNEVKKAELESKFSNEKLLELRKMAENKVAPEKIKKATENYQNAIDKIKERADKIKDTAENNSEVNKFLEKFTNQQVLQEKILQKLQTQVPEAVFEKIKEAREQHLERFKDVMTKLEENKDKIVEKLKNALQNGDESNTEILEKIKEKMPEEIKQKLEGIKENVREKVNIKLIEKATEKNETKDCLAISKPAADFCKNGIVKIQKDQKGCVIKFNCVEITSEKQCKTDNDCPHLPYKTNSEIKCLGGMCVERIIELNTPTP